MHKEANMARKFYTNKREGKWLGVCRGLADYTGFDALVIRILFAVTFLIGFGSPLVLYILIALVANDRPAGSFER
jgi:phage shock protein C